eukprot:1869720-Pyramimonas_sp.AAC.1
MQTSPTPRPLGRQTWVPEAETGSREAFPRPVTMLHTRAARDANQNWGPRHISDDGACATLCPENFQVRQLTRLSPEMWGT